MPSLIAAFKGSKRSAEISRSLEFETFAEQLEKLDLEEHSNVTRRVWETGARELAGVYRDIVNPNTGWSRNGPAVRFLVEVVRRAYPGTNPTAAAIESLLARRGPPPCVIRGTQMVLDHLTGGGKSYLRELGGLTLIEEFPDRGYWPCRLPRGVG